MTPGVADVNAGIEANRWPELFFPEIGSSPNFPAVSVRIGGPLSDGSQFRWAGVLGDARGLADLGEGGPPGQLGVGLTELTDDLLGRVADALHRESACPHGRE